MYAYVSDKVVNTKHRCFLMLYFLKDISAQTSARRRAIVADLSELVINKLEVGNLAFSLYVSCVYKLYSVFMRSAFLFLLLPRSR